MSLPLFIKPRLLCGPQTSRQDFSPNPQARRRTIADRELNELKKSLAKIDPGAGKLTVGALADCYLKSITYLDDKTVRTRQSIAKRFKATWPGGVEQPIQGVRTSELQTWLGRHSSRGGKATLNGFVRQMFTLALNDRMAMENPAAGIKQRRLDKPIRETPTWEQFQTMVKGRPLLAADPVAGGVFAPGPS